MLSTSRPGFTQHHSSRQSYLYAAASRKAASPYKGDMRMRYDGSGAGFIAITTAIILSLVLIGIALTLGSSSVVRRISGIDTINKSKSAAIARSCVDYALLQLVQNSNYVGNEIRTIASQQCTILAVETVGQQKIIKTQATIQNLFTNLRATVQITPFQLVSLEEVASF